MANTAQDAKLFLVYSDNPTYACHITFSGLGAGYI
jgi:hypothetical protein